MRLRSFAPATSLVVATVLTPAVLFAQATPASPAGNHEAEARTHFDRGRALFEAQDYAGALAEFQAAYESSNRASVLYNIGVAYQQLHQYPEAAQSIERYLREATLTPERRADVEHGLDEIRAFIAHITVSGAPTGAVITVDGQRAGTMPLAGPLAVATGRHTIEVSAPGYEPAHESLLIAGGQARDVHVEMHAEAVATAVVGPAAATTSIRVEGAPQIASVTLDEQSLVPATDVTVQPGSHHVRVRAAHMDEWQGDVDVAQGSHRVVRVHLVEAGRWSVVPFAVTAAAAGALAIGGIVTGVLTAGTHASFAALHQGDPMAAGLSQTGSAEQIVTDVLFGAAIVAGGIAVYAITRTGFSGTRSRVDVAAGPGGHGGAAASLRVRF